MAKVIKMDLSDEERARITISQGRRFMRSGLEDEAKRMLWDKKTANPVQCPCCGKNTSLRIDEPDLMKWGYALWEIYKHAGTEGDAVNGNKFFLELAQSQDPVTRARGEAANKSRDWTRWTLLGVLKSVRKGKYVVTQLGAKFIYERAAVPRRVATLKGDVLALDNDKMTFRDLVEEAGGDYGQLLAEGTRPS